MKVVLCTGHGPEYQEMAEITGPLLQRYADKHGYDMLYDAARNDKDACKAELFAEAFATGRYGPDDIFVWVDTDALVMNSNVRIETIVYQHMPRNIHYLIGVDPNGINSGVFFARFSDEAAQFIRIANNTSVISGWADQIGLQQVGLFAPHRDIWKTVAGKVFNCNLYDEHGWDWGEYGNYVNRYEPGDFILHLAGCPEPHRSELLRTYAQGAI